LPLGLFSFATTIYYLLVNNVPWLKALFPRFELFLLVGVVFGVPATLIIGQLYIRSELNKASTRTHPYASILMPAQFDLYEGMARLMRANGEAELAGRLEELVRVSREKW